MSIVNDMIKEMGEDVKRLLIKSSYPLTGNLSKKVKKSLEKVLGDDFDVCGATTTSYATNILVNSFIVYQQCKTNGKPVSEAMAAAGIATLITFVESAIRWGISEYKKNYPEPESKSYPASLVGEIVSLPVEYIINLYRKSKGELKCQ